MIGVEQQIRCALHDVVNRTSRKPFLWGGLAGYDQLTAIAHTLHQLPSEPETTYLRSILFIRRQTSGFVEGLNNKIKVLKRRWYGLRNVTRLFQRLTLDLEGYRRFSPWHTTTSSGVHGNS